MEDRIEVEENARRFERLVDCLHQGVRGDIDIQLLVGACRDTSDVGITYLGDAYRTAQARGLRPF